MKILVKAKPNSKVEKVERFRPLSDDPDAKRAGIPVYKVSVKTTPTEGRANDAIIRALAAHFEIPRASVRIVSGNTSTQKIVEIVGRSL